MPNWLRVLLRWEPGISLAQWAYDRIANNWTRIVSLGGGAAMIYLSTITGWLSALGAAGIFGASVLTVIVIWLGIAAAQVLRIKVRTQKAELDAFNKWKEQVSQINPLSSNYNGIRIAINDLVHPIRRSIENKTFTDCELIGPSNLVLIGNGNYVNVEFNNCYIVVLKPADRILMHNAVRLSNVNIFRSAIWNATIFISGRDVKTFAAMGAVFVSLTGDQEIDSGAPQGPVAKSQP
jgi:hypothetical protein